MFINSWIECVGQSLKRGSRRKNGRRDHAVRAAESLEQRALLSGQAFFLGGEIDITLGTTDSVAVREDPVAPGNVQILLNGSPLANFPTVSASAVTKVLITGGDDGNVIDLTGMTAAAFNNAALSIEVHAGNGADTLLGSDSLNDSLDGGHGADSIVGNGGNDTLLGDDGSDTINGGAGNDNIDAGDGQDTVDGGNGNDTILAGDGEDVIDGSAGSDSISGDDGMDTLRGGDDGDFINAGAGLDSVDGQNGNDTIFGGADNDTLLGGSGADSVDGQGGNDLEYAEDTNGQAIVSTSLTSPTVFSTDFNSGVPTQISGTTTTVAVQGYAGMGTGTNTFTGNLLENSSGGTELNPGVTPQTPTTLTLTNLPTHTSIDLNFLLAIINSWDGFTATVNPIVSPEFFNVRIDGTLLFRHSFDNTPANGTFEDYVSPAGVLLTPRPYSDLGFPSTGPANSPDSAWNLGLDPLFDNIPHTASTLTIDFFADGAGFQGGTNESWGIDNLTVILNGVPVANTILSNDTLLGSAGDDTLNGADGNDLLNGGAGVDVIDGADGNDSLLGGNGNDSITAGDGDDTVRGQAGSDTITGTAGADLLDGGAGNDVIGSGGTTVPVLMSIDNVTSLEGTGGTSVATFTVTLSAASANTITVQYTTVAGSATSPNDYIATASTLTFAPGATTQTISVQLVTDSIDEFNENFQVLLFNSAGALLSDSSGLATIVDDDGASTVVSSQVAFSAATNYLTANASQFGLTQQDVQNFVVTDQYTTAHNGVTQLYLQQTYQDVSIVDATINVNILADGSILSANSSFVPDVESLDLSAVPALTADQAFADLGMELALALANDPQHGSGHFSALESESDTPSRDEIDDHSEDAEVTPLEIRRSGLIPDRLQWVRTEDGGLELAWTLNVQTVGQLGWYDASVSAATGQLVHNSSWVEHATYNVLRYDVESPLVGSRTLQVDPQDSVASPFGWHDTNGATGAEFTDTRGNNVFAQLDRTGNLNGTGPRPDGGAGLIFDFPLNLSLPSATYSDAATTNLFYMSNILHDIHYQYGFDEASGNFQLNNYGRGGVGGDQVLASAQAFADLFVLNNAFMIPLPEGFSPIFAMGLFDIDFSTGATLSPPPDSDFDNLVIIHEYGHGISTRLTGGPANSNSLSAIQSGGMGEGWSDWWGLMFTQQVGDLADDPRTVGNFVQGQTVNGPGIRRFPYSFDMLVDPLTFANFNGGFPNNEVHNVGEIWSSALWDLNWLLINGINTPDCEGNTTAGYGFDPDLYHGTGGNNIALQLIMDGLKLQPANPTFTQARDAILQADMVNFGGANERAIWTAFARRGLGFSADSGPNADSTAITPAFDLPPELGAIRLDKQIYNVGDRVVINVCDADRAAVTSTITVTVTTTTGDSENVILNRLPDQTFGGSILIQRGIPTPNNGVLDISAEADLLTVTYFDLDNGAGQSVTLQTLAVINAAQGDTLLGGEGNDSLVAGEGDDFINADGGNDTAFGGNGDDSMLGGAGNDLLDGQAGDDTLSGQGGSDTLIGGEGNDVFLYDPTSNGDDVVSSLGGFDEVQITTSNSADTILVTKLGPKLKVVSGTNELTINADIHVVSIDTGAGDDVVTVGDLLGVSQTLLTINGGDGNDKLDASAALLGDVRLRLNGDAGNDTILGSTNEDTIDGGAGKDTLLGGAGNDTIIGGADNDAVNGQAGDDSITGDDGNDTLSGGDGKDVISGGLGNDALNGNVGNDTLTGAEGRDTLQGSDGNDSLDAGGGKDYLSGGNDSDTLDGGRNDDTILGDAGADTIRGNHGNDNIDGGSGDDTISGGDGNDTVTGGDGNDLATGADGDDVINGAAGNDTLTGSDGRDLIAGGAGGDIILGDDGDDTLKGNGGINTLAGGQGTDTLVSLPTDFISESFTISDDLLKKLDLI